MKYTAVIKNEGAQWMSTRHFTKMVHEGDYVAEVDVDLIYEEEGWSPYLSLQDANRLDDVREALRRGDLTSAGKLSRVYTLTRVAV
ncbi:MAG: hypothetical protein ACLQMF_04255 [Rectinemataceae bacterium]